jgi:hypothetical protein
MPEPTISPSPLTEKLLFCFFAGGSHAAVLAGGIVRPEPLAWIAAAQSGRGWCDAGRLWAALLSPWRDAAAPFVVTVGWTLLGFLLAYLAARRLFGAFVALAAVGLTTIAGYPGWDAALPGVFRLWLTPAALAAWLLSLALAGPLAPVREWLTRRSEDRALKALWAGLLVFAFFSTAEHLRVGLRGAHNGRFPYADCGLPHGFDKELTDLRRLHHAFPFAPAMRWLTRGGLLYDNEACGLAGHGAAARFVGRIGAARPDVTRMRPAPHGGWRPPRYLTRVGWLLRSTEAGWAALPCPDGIRYNEWRGKLEDVDAGDWTATRRRIQLAQPVAADISGPVSARAVAKMLWLEVECGNPADVEAQAKLAGEPLGLVRRELAAGDRVIVRFAAILPDRLADPTPLEISVQAPQRMWDLDLFLQAPENPKETGVGPRPR